MFIQTVAIFLKQQAYDCLTPAGSLLVAQADSQVLVAL